MATKVKGSLSISRSTKQKFNTEKFNLKKPYDAEVKEQH
jgi:hypothetical protein